MTPARAAVAAAWRAQLADELRPSPRAAVATADRKAGGDATTLRLIVTLPVGRRGGKTVARAIQRALGPDAHGLPWRVAPLFPRVDGTPSRLTRFLSVTGRVEGAPSEPLSKQAFELARELADAVDVEVEPDLASSIFEPAPPAGPVERRSALGSGGDDGRVGGKYWSLDAINCKRAWQLEPTRGEGIRIGHPDTGYTEHPELEPDALDLTVDLDLLSGDDDARDPLDRRWWWLDSPGHGTATASVIAGREAGELTGAAPGATVVPLRAIKSVVQVRDGDVARAVDYARAIGCDVVSMSLGGLGFTPALREAIAAAVESGMIVMAAAGNRVRFVTAPARYPECLAVAATNIDGRPWSGSSRGSEVDFAAPGENVWAAAVDRGRKPPGRWLREPRSGTSYAVAHSAGAAALWIAHHGRDELRRRYGSRLQSVFRELVRQTAKRPDGWDGKRYGAGILDVAALLEAPLPEPDAGRRASSVAPAPAAPPLAALLSELPERQRRARLRELLGVAPAELDSVLDRFGSEIAFLLAEDEGLRAAVATTGAASPAAAANGGAKRPVGEALRRRASPSLAAALA